MKALHLLRNKKGLSITEIIVATGILGILMFAIISMKSMVFKLSQGVVQRSTTSRVIFTIQEDLVKEMDSLPFRANAGFITGATFDQALYESSFNDASTQKACYDKEGRKIPVTADPICEFRLSYYRVQEVDRNYSGGNATIPLSRLVMRAEFTDKNTKTTRTLYLSRLKTHVLKY